MVKKRNSKDDRKPVKEGNWFTQRVKFALHEVARLSNSCQSSQCSSCVPIWSFRFPNTDKTFLITSDTLEFGEEVL